MITRSFAQSIGAVCAVRGLPCKFALPLFHSEERMRYFHGIFTSRRMNGCLSSRCLRGRSGGWLERPGG
jgi:hypothetical protein